MFEVSISVAFVLLLWMCTDTSIGPQGYSLVYAIVIWL
jgi:hypothetical protein